MLEHVPGWLGNALRGVRAGADKLAIVELAGGMQPSGLELTSPAFADGARLPVRFTGDGEGVSPPLLWRGVPENANSLALIVEDADAPTPSPIIHAVAWNIDPEAGGLDEGAIDAEADGGHAIGRNSLGEGWLPPDPPTGHGSHDYVFQLFALDAPLDLGRSPGRSALVGAMRGRVLAAGLLTGTYSRGEEAPVSLGALARA